jgi:hypothetical protein
MTVSFDPLVDGFHIGDDWPIGAAGAETIWRAFQSSVAPALEILKPSFRNALDLHDVAGGLSRQLQPHRFEWFGRRAALIYAALDYWVARVPPPLKLQFGRQGKSEKIEQFLRRRALDGAQAIAPELLAAAGVLKFVPEHWIPEALLTAPLKRTIENLGVFADTKIELELKLPFPGGAPWLGQQAREDFGQLKSRLDAGRPWPVVLIPDSGDPYGARVMLAFHYEMKGQNAASIECYDPGLPAQPQIIEIAFGEDGTVTGSLEKGSDPFHLKGLICCQYNPAEPPLNFLLHLVHRLWGWKIVWLVWRSFRRRFRMKVL